MAKAKWGEKRTCPKCGTRFYDLGKDDPLTCIECEHTWTAEPILKSKQPHVAPAKKEKPEEAKEKDDEDADDLDVNLDDDEETNPDDDIDIGDDDVPVVVAKDDKEES